MEILTTQNEICKIDGYQRAFEVPLSAEPLVWSLYKRSFIIIVVFEFCVDQELSEV